ncbi:MAG: Hydrolase-2 domain-containing protein [Lachnoclostridium sp.]|jgi:N-acetylmuramoyl-L-alanine amidase
MLKIHSFLQRVKKSLRKVLPANLCRNKTGMVAVAYTMITVLLLLNPDYIYGTDYNGTKPYAKAKVTPDVLSDTVEETEQKATISTNHMESENKLNFLDLAAMNPFTGLPGYSVFGLANEEKPGAQLLLNLQITNSDNGNSDTTDSQQTEATTEVSAESNLSEKDEQKTTVTSGAENTKKEETVKSNDSDKNTVAKKVSVAKKNSEKKTANSKKTKKKTKSGLKNKTKSDKSNRKYVIKLSDSELEILQRIVEAEATGEDLKGKILVANVILNRVKNKNFPDTVQGVVFQKNGGTYQFSPIKDKRYWSVKISKDTVKAVEKAMQGEDYSQGALYFSARSKADKNSMRWFDNNLDYLFRYGGHEFFK